MRHKEQARSSEGDTGLGNSSQYWPETNSARRRRSLSWRWSCVVGVLVGLVGLITPYFTGPATTADVSIQAVAILLGIVGYYLGTRRLAIVVVGLCIVAIFFGLAASQDLIPGIQGEDRSLPSVEPNAQRPDS